MLVTKKNHSRRLVVLAVNSKFLQMEQLFIIYKNFVNHVRREKCT